MAIGRPEEIAPEAAVHRVGGGDVSNLRLSDLDGEQVPAGVSVLLGGTPQEAAEQMRHAFPGSKKWKAVARTVGTTSAGAIRQAGFEIVPDPTRHFPNHARLIHANGIAGFTAQNLQLLSRVFQNFTEC